MTPVAIQLRLTGIDGVPRAFLHQKTHRLRRAGGWSDSFYKETYWQCLGVFDRPLWCRLVDKPVEVSNA